MTFDSLKRSIYSAILQTEFNTNDFSNEEINSNKILVGCVSYKILNSIMNSNKQQDGQSRNISLSYVSNYKNIVENMKNKYVSYRLIVDYINDQNIKSFLNIKEFELNHIYELYCNKTEISVFNCLTFSQTMYNVSGLSDYQISILNKVHYNVIVPIIRYYKENYNILDKNVAVLTKYTSEETPNPQNSILLKIQDIESSKILLGINSGIFGINNLILKASIINNFIEIQINPSKILNIL